MCRSHPVQSWPAIRSSAPNTQRPSFAKAMEGTILRSSLCAERRMVEAAGVEPASLANLPAATTCLFRKDFSAVR